MFEPLEMRTLLIVGALVCLTLAGVMVHHAATRKTYPGYRHWTTGIVCLGVGAALVTMRGVLPDSFTIILANFLVVLMPLLLTRGLALFLGVEWKAAVLNIVVVMIFLLVFFWGTYIHRSFHFRVLCLNVVSIIFYGEALYLAIKYLQARIDFKNNILVVSIAATMTSILARIVLTIFDTEKTTLLHYLGGLHSIVVLLTLLTVAGIIFSLFILNAHRIENDLQIVKSRIENLANRDGLTNLFNRRFFDKKLENEFRRLQRCGRPISLIMADIDCFKLYNDTYGHPAGDECIIKIADAFKQSGTRASDFSARYGGEEFVMLLPETDLAGAQNVADTILRIVNDAHIPHKRSAVSDVVTLSIGVATIIPDMSMSPGLLVAVADKALYKSKENGKNQIQSHDHDFGLTSTNAAFAQYCNLQ